VSRAWADFRSELGSVVLGKKNKRVSSLPPPWLLLTERRSIIPNKTLRRLHDKSFDKPCIMAVAVPTTADRIVEADFYILYSKNVSSECLSVSQDASSACSAAEHRQIDQTCRSIIVVYELSCIGNIEQCRILYMYILYL